MKSIEKIIYTSLIVFCVSFVLIGILGVDDWSDSGQVEACFGFSSVATITVAFMLFMSKFAIEEQERRKQFNQAEKSDIKNRNKRLEKFNSDLSKMMSQAENFTFSDTHIFNNKELVIAVDEDRGKILIGGAKSDCGSLEFEIINACDIIRVDLIKDNNSISSSNTGNVIISSLAGGLLFGGIGAVVGGIAGSNIRDVNKNLILKFFLNNIKKPVVGVDFYGGVNVFDKQEVSDVEAVAEKWYSITLILIDRQKKMETC